MKSSFYLFCCFLFLISGNLNGQSKYVDYWKQVGPTEPPTNRKYRSDGGIGPIEFIRTYQKKEGHLLAGSLSGGLFYSSNGGDSWESGGSDHWPYTGCAWADFHPDHENVWFACSNFEGDNGKPGRIEDKGGVMRTIDGGKSWNNIGDLKSFGGSGYLKIYGTRFHPTNSDLLLVLTSEGLYYTLDCMASFVKWNRVPNIKGWVYDLDFIGETMYVSNFLHGQWSVLKIDIKSLEGSQRTRYDQLKFVADETRSMRNLTIEPAKDQLLIAMDFKSGQDEVYVYDSQTDSNWLYLENQRISFGSGYTFAVSPHDYKTVYFGYATQVNKWSFPDGEKLKIDRKYHVDIEYVAFDPFDSLKVYIATHGGVFVSEDSGGEWRNTSIGMGVTEVMGLAVSKEDPQQIAIGCYHDGSILQADYDKNGTYTWRTVNGGDGLLPLIHPSNQAIVYTSNQYVGGGLYYSQDTSKTERFNMHANNGFKTSGWEMAAVMDYYDNNTIFFNFLERKGINKDNINVARTNDPGKSNSAEVISDFNASHGLEKYKVYGLFNTRSNKNVLIAYVLHFVKDETGKQRTEHLLFRTDQANSTPLKVMKSWYRIQHPNNTWIGDVEVSDRNKNLIYLSYVRGKTSPETIFGDRGMVYRLLYKNNERHRLKREMDISKNIPSSMAGRHNMYYTEWGGGSLFIATRTGVYLASGRALKGRARWQIIGQGLPHCKVYGLKFNEKQKVLTVGFFGRGVWQYQF